MTMVASPTTLTATPRTTAATMNALRTSASACPALMRPVVGARPVRHRRPGRSRRRRRGGGGGSPPGGRGGGPRRGGGAARGGEPREGGARQPERDDHARGHHQRP